MPVATDHEMALFSAPRRTESTHRKQQVLVHLRGQVHAELTEGPCDGSTGMETPAWEECVWDADEKPERDNRATHCACPQQVTGATWRRHTTESNAQ